jgi:tRNA(Ile)-lysidine synthase
MLEVTRAELRAYCVRHGIGFREDPTNVTLGTPRNRIRAILLPALERRRPGASRRLSAIAGAARALESAWRGALQEVAQRTVVERSNERVVLAREALLGYDPNVRTRLLRHELRRLGHAPGRSGTRAVDEFINTGRSGKGIALSGGTRVEREGGRIVLRRTQARSEDSPLRIMAPESGAGLALIGGRRLRVHWSMARATRAGEAIELDPATLSFPLELRAWRAGDRIRFDYGSKKLKKLFLERGIARAERARTPVLADSAGRVLWVRGIARAHGCEPAASAAGFHITVVDE